MDPMEIEAFWDVLLGDDHGGPLTAGELNRASVAALGESVGFGCHVGESQEPMLRGWWRCGDYFEHGPADDLYFLLFDLTCLDSRRFAWA